MQVYKQCMYMHAVFICMYVYAQQKYKIAYYSYSSFHTYSSIIYSIQSIEYCKMGSSPAVSVSPSLEFVPKLEHQSQPAYCATLKQNIEILEKQQLDAQQILVIQKILEKQFFASQIDDHEHIKNLALNFQKAKSIAKYDWLFKQGSSANYLFILAKGKVDVIKDNYYVRSLHAGDIFGEFALLYGIKRSSSVKISKQFKNSNQYYVLKKSLFLEFIQDIGDENSEQIKQLVQDYLPFKFFAIREQKQILRNIFKISFPENKRIFTKFDEPYGLFFIVQGSVKISYPNRQPIYLEAGNSFGYQGSTSNHFSAITSENCKCLAIGKQSLDNILKNNIIFLYIQCQLKHTLLWNKFLKQISYDRISAMIKKFKFRKVKNFEPICRLNQFISKLYVPINCLDSQSFHEIYGIQQIYQKKRYYSKDLMALCQGYIAQIQIEDYDEILQHSETSKYLQSKHHKIKAFQLQKCQQIGCIKYDQYGQAQQRLFLQERYGKQFILKVFKNQTAGSEKIFKNYKQILQNVDSPFIRSCYCTHSAVKGHQIFLQYIHGIPLNRVMQQIGLLPMLLVKFYASILIQITQKLHKISVISRNWSICDYIIDSLGYLWLVSLKNSKILKQSNLRQSRRMKEISEKKTKTINNLPYLCAPQMIRNQQYGTQIDFWGIGILIYYMKFGKYPFGSDKQDPMQIYDAILKQQIDYPLNMRSIQFKQMIKKMLAKNNKERISLKLNGVKQLGFFRGVDWQKLVKKDVESPYLPTIKQEYATI